MTRDFSEFLEQLKAAPTKWTVAKIICCLKCIFPNKMLKRISLDELKLEESDVFEEKRIVEKVVEDIYNKCQLPQTYKPIKDAINEIYEIKLCPGVHNGLTIEEFFETEQPLIGHGINGNAYCTKHDMIFAINYIVRQSKYTSLADMFLKKWIASFLGKGFDLLKGTYSHLPISVMENMFDSFYTPITELPFVRPLKIEDFERLRWYFDRNDVKGLFFFDKVFMKKFNSMNETTPISTNQHLYIASYVQIMTIRSRLKYIFDEILKPALTCEMKNDCAVVRLLVVRSERIMFAIDLEEALQVAIKKNHPEITYRSGLFPLEDHKTRIENGIINGVNYEKFENILKILRLRPVHDIDYVPIVVHPGNPIISPYGTLCLNAEDAYENLIGLLVSLVGYFQTIYKEKFVHVAVWMEQFEPTFGKQKCPTFVQMSKLTDIYNRVGHELKMCHKTENLNFYRVPYKPVYEFAEVLIELKRLIGDLEERDLVAIFEGMIVEGHFDIRSIYILYEQFIKMRLCRESETVRSFGYGQYAVKLEEDEALEIERVWNNAKEEVLNGPGPSNRTPLRNCWVAQETSKKFIAAFLRKEARRILRRPRIINEMKFEELERRERNLNNGHRNMFLNLILVLKEMKKWKAEKEPCCSGEQS